MEQIDIITLAFIGLALLAIAFGIWAFIAFARSIDQVPFDDMPGHYEDHEFSERPFIEYN